MGVNVLLYDEDNMKAYSGEIINVQETYEPFFLCESFVCQPERKITLEIRTKEELFELSPAMMMRIRRYNQGKKQNDMLVKIADAKKELVRLEEEINTKRERVKKIQEVTESIWSGDSVEDYDDSMDW